MEKEAWVCAICQDNERKVCLPCGHLVLCVECANSIASRSPLCPCCRQPFTHYLRTTNEGTRKSFDEGQASNPPSSWHRVDTTHMLSRPQAQVPAAVTVPLLNNPHQPPPPPRLIAVVLACVCCVFRPLRPLASCLGSFLAHHPRLSRLLHVVWRVACLLDLAAIAYSLRLLFTLHVVEFYCAVSLVGCAVLATNFWLGVEMADDPGDDSVGLARLAGSFMSRYMFCAPLHIVLYSALDPTQRGNRARWRLHLMSDVPLLVTLVVVIAHHPATLADWDVRVCVGVLSLCALLSTLVASNVLTARLSEASFTEYLVDMLVATMYLPVDLAWRALWHAMKALCRGLRRLLWALLTVWTCLLAPVVALVEFGGGMIDSFCELVAAPVLPHHT